MRGQSRIIMNNRKVSLIVPTKNSKEFIFECLKSIKNQTYKHIEIIVVDNNSKDGTKGIAKGFTNLVFNKGPERSAQRNFGASKATGEYLFFVDSDMVLTKNVVSECVKKARSGRYKAIVIPEKSFGKGFWAECKMLERSFYWGIDWIESARFFETKLFNEFGGYDQRNTGTEDFDLPQRIKNKDGDKSIGRIKGFMLHNEGNASLLNILRKKYYYSRKLAVYKLNNEKYFKKQANLLNRYYLFFSDPKKLFSSPLVGIGMLFMKTSEFFVGGVCYLYISIKNNIKI